MPVKNSLELNKELCLKCKICVDVCPGSIMSIGEDGYPTSQKLAFCIQCGHCVAYCPTKAIELELVPLKGQEEIVPALPKEQAASFLRRRRSVRKYKQEKVSKELMRELLDIARMAPSGGNTQGLSFLIIEDNDTLSKISEAVLDFIEEGVAAGKLAGAYGAMASDARKTGRDMVLRGAPCLIVAHAPQSMSWGKDNARFALAYAELFAPSLGFGTCWAGFVDMCAFSGYPKLLELLKLPEGHSYCASIMAGFPEYKCRRMVERKPLNISWS